MKMYFVNFQFFKNKKMKLWDITDNLLVTFHEKNPRLNAKLHIEIAIMQRQLR